MLSNGITVEIKDEPYKEYWEPRYKIPKTGVVEGFLPDQKCYVVKFGDRAFVMAATFLRKK
jgi:hypothetical protein